MDTSETRENVQGGVLDRCCASLKLCRYGIVKLSGFEQKLGNTQIHNSLIVQHSGYWPEVENQLSLT